MLRRRFPPLVGKRVSWSIGQAADPICLSRIMSSFSRVADRSPPLACAAPLQESTTLVLLLVARDFYLTIDQHAAGPIITLPAWLGGEGGE